ncbi:DUF4440 domain-containing protein [Variovorax sp. KK3]|uniref:YybH family protein n=1 Tax=Variovorax sp. KK3 TaxID=1855728 RepID=UPI00097C14F3|nr:DUF4440 domain-containing protein [Variovorax sp. KK3]
MSGYAPGSDELEALLQRTDTANTALLQGDIDGYLGLISHTDDFTLMQPFGGPVVRGLHWPEERKAELKRFFRGGEGQVEFVQWYASGDLAVLVAIERQRVVIADLPEQDWSLRITLVYRLSAEGAWQLAHRHADPIVRSISVARAAAIARGA